MKRPVCLMQNQQGFTLIEALVAFLILSIGMLGIASLQTVSLRAGSTAALRSVAVIKAGEIMERMRSNPTALDSYAATASSTGADNNCSDSGGGSVAECSPSEMAEDDIYNWLNDLKAAIPGDGNTNAVISITPVGAGSSLSQVDVTISWSERSPGSQSASTQTYSMSSVVCGALKC